MSVSGAVASSPPARLHHHSFVTNDQEATRRFYEDVVGLSLVATWTEVERLMGGGEEEFCHTFYGLADGGGLAFFQFANSRFVEQHAPPAAQSPFRHIALLVTDEQQASTRARAEATGIETMSADHGYCRSLYIRDPNGLLLEFTVDHPDVRATTATRSRMHQLREEQDMTQTLLTTPSMDAYRPLEPIVHHEPQRVADDVFVIRQLQGEGLAPVSVYINSVVIDGAEPVILDTGTRANRRQWLNDVFSIVAPERVRWIYVTHDDVDHVGNICEVLEVCPNATLVASWLITERLTPELNLPLTRMRWLEDGDSLVLGDRTLVALRPPTFDSPTTRGVFDTRSRVYYASDSFGAAVPHHVDLANELPAQAWTEGFVAINCLVSPWVGIADPGRFAEGVKTVEALGADVVVSTHGPAITSTALPAAYETMTRLPELIRGPLPPVPGQAELDAIVAMITSHGA